MLWDLINGWDETIEIKYRYATLISTPHDLLDQESQNFIEQYEYCKEFSISPYPGSYLEHAAAWHDAVRIIKSETINATNYAERKYAQKQQSKGKR